MYSEIMVPLRHGVTAFRAQNACPLFGNIIYRKNEFNYASFCRKSTSADNKLNSLPHLSEPTGVETLSNLKSVKHSNSYKRYEKFGAALIVGSLLGGAYSYFQSKKKENARETISEPLKDAYLCKNSEAALNVLPFKEVRTPELEGIGPNKYKWTLFQYMTCPFCCKVRATLDYFGIDYNLVEVNSVTRAQMKWSTYKKVPLLLVETNEGAYQVVDSSLIMSVLKTFINDSSQTIADITSSYPYTTHDDGKGKVTNHISNRYYLMFGEKKSNRSEKDLKSEIKWREWVDDSLVHVISPNVYRTLGEAFETFRWFDERANWKDVFSSWERYLVVYIGAIIMYIIGKRLKKKYDIHDDVRQSLYEHCDKWCKALEENNSPFMGGARPDLSDLAVFGVLNAMEGCTAFDDALNNTDIGVWFNKMKIEVESKNGQEIWSKSKAVNQSIKQEKESKVSSLGFLGKFLY